MALQKLLRLWANNNLPENADHFAKLKEEINELFDAPEDPDEMADVLLALILHADSLGIDLMTAAYKKFKIVQDRKYREADGNGISRHFTDVEIEEIRQKGTDWLDTF